jgi:hypothetical protein
MILATLHLQDLLCVAVGHPDVSRSSIGIEPIESCQWARSVGFQLSHSTDSPDVPNLPATSVTPPPEAVGVTSQPSRGPAKAPQKSDDPVI